MSNWFVYLLECSDGTFYTGITTDIDRRVEEHNNGPKGAKYTKARRPVHLVYQETCATRSQAGQREYALRKLSRTEKIKLGKKT
ncbi:MAG: GIY-YIG nuclease family protein [Candidatus Pacebacteria bacterium]|nr:GIY-YIG nuclease family protein [Candidatus Paceibacterota bacterium]